MTEKEDHVLPSAAFAQALFRYGVISHLLQTEADKWKLATEVRNLAAREWIDPHGQKVSISSTSIYRWLRRYRQNGFSGLFRRQRTDAGKPRSMSCETLSAILDLRDCNPELPAAELVEMLPEKNAGGRLPARSTLYRHLAEPDRDRRRTAVLVDRADSPITGISKDGGDTGGQQGSRRAAEADGPEDAQDRQWAYKVAQWRFQRIKPLLQRNLSAADRGHLAKAIAAVPVVWPSGQEGLVSQSSLYRWLKMYRQKPRIESLMPAPRTDPSVPRAIKQEWVDYAVELLENGQPIAILVLAHEIARHFNLEEPPAKASLHRALRKDVRYRALKKECSLDVSLRQDPRGRFLDYVKLKLYRSLMTGASYDELLREIPTTGKEPPLLASPLTVEQHDALRKLWRTGRPHERRFCAIMELAAIGLAPRDIADITSVSSSTVARTIAAHNDFGLCLPRRRRTPSPAYAERKKRILEIFHATPRAYDINRTTWSGSALSRAYRETYAEDIGRSTACRMIASEGYRASKARRVLTSSDPEYREKVERLLRILHELKKDEALFFVDELGPMRVKKYGGRSYVKKGQVKTVPQRQTCKGSISLVGALSATANQVTWFYCPSKDSAAMIDLAEILFNQYNHMRRIYLTWDAASWHGSNALVDWLDSFNAGTRSCEGGPIIELVPLPTNAQFLDVIEAVFSAMKRAVIHNSDYRSPHEMKAAVSRHFQERNEFFKDNPRRAGKKIWEIDFFRDTSNLRSGNYRDW